MTGRIHPVERDDDGITARVAPAGRGDDALTARLAPAGRGDDTLTARLAPAGRGDDTLTARLAPAGHGDDTLTARLAPAGRGDDSASVRIRPLRPEDGELLDRVVDGMGPQSRYQRFHAPKPRLTSGERRYLTNVDGHDHLALLALAPDGAPLGVVRCVRLREDPKAAELAVEVIDAWQGRGLGTALMAQLARRAAVVGIERLVARVLDESRLAPSLKRRGWHSVERDGASWVLAVDAWTVARVGASAVRERPSATAEREPLAAIAEG